MSALDRLARWWLMRRVTEKVVSHPAYRESLPGWGTLAIGEGTPGARWRDAWIVVAIDEHANTWPVTVFHEGAGWLPLIFDSREAADDWLRQPAAAVVQDGDRPITVLRHYTTNRDHLIRGELRDALKVGAHAEAELRGEE